MNDQNLGNDSQTKSDGTTAVGFSCQAKQLPGVWGNLRTAADLSKKHDVGQWFNIYQFLSPFIVQLKIFLLLCMPEWIRIYPLNIIDI